MKEEQLAKKPLEKMQLTLNTPLTIDEVDFRIQSINNGKYATILAYKDARADMNRLDAVYGAGSWQRKHEVIDGVLYCSVGVYNDRLGYWIWVQDCGTESLAEKEKGQASDSFKRACFNLGIGRELYTYPLISIKLNDDEVQETGKDRPKYRASFNLNIKDWKWGSKFEDGVLTKLACKDTNGVVRFNWNKNK
jgi:hypothetical protein